MIDLEYTVKDKEGLDVKVQIKNTLSTDEYFGFLAVHDDNEGLKQKKQVFHYFYVNV